MHPSSSKYIELESIPLAQLFELQGDELFGIYIPVLVNGSARTSIARISANAKAYAAKKGRKCIAQTLVAMTYVGDDELPVLEKMVKISIVQTKEVSPKSKRYIAANRNISTE